MANSPRMKTAPEGPDGDAADNVATDKAALEEQLARIKADIGELASTLASIGSRRIEGARSGADDRISELTRSVEQALDDLRAQFRSVEHDLSAKVQEKPLQTLGIAAGVGFLIALIVRR